MDEIITDRLVLRGFKRSDKNDLFEFLSQLKDDEFEGCPDITYESCDAELKRRLDTNDFTPSSFRKAAR